MAWLIVLGVIALPVAEIALFAKSAQAIGALPTIAIAIALGMGGIALLRRQGVATLWRAQRQMARGGFPVSEAFDGLCLGLAGLLLVLPGFITDALGLLLLLPPVRAGLRRWLVGRLDRAAHGDAARKGKETRIRVIDADYHVVESRHKPDRDNR